MLASVVTLLFLPFVLSANVTNVAKETFFGAQQRQLTEDIEQLRKVALDLPSCGVLRSESHGSTSNRIPHSFSSNVKQFKFTGKNADDPDGSRSRHGYSIDFFRFHRWAHKEFTYTAANNAAIRKGAPLRVQLAFVEHYTPNCATGKRIFSATVNGEPFFTDLDVYDEVGCNTVLVIAKDFVGVESNKVEIKFTGSVQNPMVSIVEVRSREGCNDPCPCWTPEFVDENPISRFQVSGVRTGDQELEAWTDPGLSGPHYEISKDPIDPQTGLHPYNCRFYRGSHTSRIPLSADQAEKCRDILRPALEDYFEGLEASLTQIELPAYCGCWGSEQIARDTDRTSCSIISSYSWTRNGRFSASSNVRMRRPHQVVLLTDQIHLSVLLDLG